MNSQLPRNSAFPTYLGLHRLLGGAHDSVASNGGLLHGEHDEFVLFYPFLRKFIRKCIPMLRVRVLPSV